MEQPNDVQGINSDAAGPTDWLAQSFKPTTSGTARVASFYAQTQSGVGIGTGTIAIYSDNGGKPGTQLAAGSGSVAEVTGASPTCTVLGSSASLVAGTKYWAVFSGNKSMSWMFSRNAAMSGLYSTTSGATWATRAEKTYSLRIEDGSTCGPVLNPNPAAGTAVADMYIKPGASTFNTIFIGNSGNQALTLTGASFSGPGASSFKLLQGDPNGPQNQPFTFPWVIGASAQAGVLLYVACSGALPNGTRTATLTLTSDDPAHASISWPVSCVVNNTPPSIQFSQPPGGVNGWQSKLPASLYLTGVAPVPGDGVVDIKCTDSAGTFDFPNGADATLTITTNGTQTVSCQATDVAGNTSAPGANTTTVKVDTVPPVVSGLSGPAALTNKTSATFTWSQSDSISGVQFAKCKLDSASFSTCQSGISVSSLTDGQHTFSVQVTDNAGNVSSIATLSWTVDTVPPDTALSGGPASLTNQHTASFTVTGAGSGGRYVCSLDGVAATDCSTTISDSGLADGHHTLQVWAIDAAGNQDPTPAAASWVIDSVAPTAQITSHPDSSSTATSASFTFSSIDAGAAPLARFECSVDGAPFATCTSPDGVAGFAVQQHTFAVRAVDSLGNVQSPATTFAWTITTPPPGGGNTPPPSGTTTASAGTPAPRTSTRGTALAFTIRPALRPKKLVSHNAAALWFALSKQATVTATITGATKGSRVGTHCVAPRKRGRACNRTVRMRPLKGTFRAGTGNIRIPAAVNGKTLLAPGSYKVTLKAIASPTESVTAVLAFRVVGKRHG
jgi:hypothetical protein